ncbi:Putative Chromo-like domain superfamily protein [Septoria linicola]|uniref:Chromo-like domain superfamily protein n=1 Tax=Septoria linicola TaxID=215465 RepID=A0A9Q9B6J7_9PEZI|nr:putative Chromo-like domain superfamily protein [Septoria linicola]USW59170.1 Putative Chromo-like domain superfamily protein [Septoria linicola]
MSSWTTRGGRPNWAVVSDSFETQYARNTRFEQQARQNLNAPRPSRVTKARRYEGYYVHTVRPFENPKSKQTAPKIKVQQVPVPRPRSLDSLENTYHTKRVLAHKIRDTGLFEYEVTFEEWPETEKQWMGADLVGDDAIEEYWRDLEGGLRGHGEPMAADEEDKSMLIALELSSEDRVLMDHKIKMKHEARVARNARAAAQVAPQVTLDN